MYTVSENLIKKHYVDKMFSPDLVEETFLCVFIKDRLSLFFLKLLKNKTTCLLYFSTHFTYPVYPLGLCSTTTSIF